MPLSHSLGLSPSRVLIATPSRIKIGMATAALIHLCVQTLIPLEESGKYLDDEIGALISKGLKVEIQEAMGALRVLAYNGAGDIDLKEDKATATRIFALLKMIVERRRLKEGD
jgi:hypothetical protein